MDRRSSVLRGRVASSASGNLYSAATLMTVEQSLTSDLLIRKEVAMFLDQLAIRCAAQSGMSSLLSVVPLTSGAEANPNPAASHYSLPHPLSSSSSQSNVSAAAGDSVDPFSLSSGHAAAAPSGGEAAASFGRNHHAHLQRCRTFCILFSSIAARDLDAFRRRVNLMHRAKNSAHLTVDEVLKITDRVTVLETLIAPGRLAEYVVLSAVVAFSASRNDLTTSALHATAVACVAATLSIPPPPTAASIVAMPSTRNGNNHSSNAAVSSPTTTGAASSVGVPPHPPPSVSPHSNGESPSKATHPLIPTTPVPFFRILAQDAAICAKYRVPPSNSSRTLLNAVFFVVTVWEDHPYQWPLLVDPHRVVEGLWLRRLPRSILVRYDHRNIHDVLDAYMHTHVLLVLTEVPGELDAAMSERLFDRSRSAAEFRLLLVYSTGLQPPAWTHSAPLCTMVVPEVDGVAVSQLLLEEVYGMAWHRDAIAMEEVYVDVLESTVRETVDEERLWSAAVDSLPADAAAFTERARRTLATTRAHLDSAKAEVETFTKCRAEYRIVSEIGHRLFRSWGNSELRQAAQVASTSASLGAASAEILPLHEFVETILRPAVHQHLTEGTKHVTKCKTSAAQEILAWSSRLSERLLLESQNKKGGAIPESHGSVSLALHVLSCFVFGRMKDHVSPLGPVEQHRRIIALWDASLESSAGSGSGSGQLSPPQRGASPPSSSIHLPHSAAVGSNSSTAPAGAMYHRGGSVLSPLDDSIGGAHSASTSCWVGIPKPMVEFALQLFPPTAESESDVFARLQRLLLTMTSIRALLSLDAYQDSVREFTDWLGHVQLTVQRLAGVEEEVFAALVRGLLLLNDATRGPELVDALSLFVILRELLGAIKGIHTALRTDVPKRKARAMGKLLDQFWVECESLEQEAAQMIVAVTGADGVSVNPNKVLDVRDRVAELRVAKERLIKTEPTGRQGSGMPMMRSVDRLVALCLPDS